MVNVACQGAGVAGRLRTRCPGPADYRGGRGTASVCRPVRSSSMARSRVKSSVSGPSDPLGFAVEGQRPARKKSGSASPARELSRVWARLCTVLSVAGSSGPRHNSWNLSVRT